MNRSARRYVAAAALLALVACSGEAKRKMPHVDEPKEEGVVHAVELSMEAVTLSVGERWTLDATVRGEGDLDPEVVWASSDSAVAAVDEGVVSAVAPGEATITAASRADASKSAAATFTVLPPPTQGRLVLNLEGLPRGLDAQVEVRGPEGFEATVQESRTLEALEPGAYQIRAVERLHDEVRYTPTPAQAEVELRAGESPGVRIVFEGEPFEPFRLQAQAAILPLHAHVDMALELIRDPSFDGPVTVSAEGLPEGVVAEAVTIPAGEDRGFIRLVSDRSIRTLGPYEFELVATGDTASDRRDAEVWIKAVVTEFTDAGVGTLRYYVELLPELEESWGSVIPPIGGGPPDPPVRIQFAPPTEVPVTITLESPLVIDGFVQIDGPMREEVPFVALDGNDQSRLMVIENESVVGVSRLSFRGGKATDGGAILNRGLLDIIDSRFEANAVARAGGAIMNEGDLRVERVTFQGNEAKAGGAIANGYQPLDEEHRPWLDLLDVDFIENEANEAGGAVVNHGGTLDARDSTFRGNVSYLNGGALALEGGRYTIRASLFEANDALRAGGAIHSAGQLHVDACTFAENEASTGDGGGIATAEDAQVSNATFANNVAERGGALSVTEPTGHLVLHHATVSGNTGTQGGGIYNGGLVELSHSIVAGNSATEGPDLFAGPTADDTRSLSSNLFGTLAGAGIAAGASDLEGEDPGLEELADYGGPTLTMALGPESPARDAIPAEECPTPQGGPLNVDQRGERRPAGAGCDIGAYELQPDDEN